MQFDTENVHVVAGFEWILEVILMPLRSDGHVNATRLTRSANKHGTAMSV